MSLNASEKLNEARMSASDRNLCGLIDEINTGRLIIRPPFQRRLVWTNRDKELFIDTVLKKMPFPEIFVCTGESDPIQPAIKQWLVDGQQRMTTLRDYVAGSEDILYINIPKYADLPDEDKRQFLETTVAVRDMKRVSSAQLKEIFTRINSTSYQLTAMERRHAKFSGEYKAFCDDLSSQNFFEGHEVVPKGRAKRMEDLAFCVNIVTTILAGYYQRDSKNEEYLERYNDGFPEQERMQIELDKVFDFIERCSFSTASPKSPAWKLTNLFTLIVELHQALIVQGMTLSPEKVGQRLKEFFDQIGHLNKTLDSTDDDSDIFKYWKAAKTAANDKHSRVLRAEVISKILADCATHQNAKSTRTKTTKKNSKS